MNNASAVMNPYDGGLTTLRSDEILGAQTLYPGTNSGVTTPAPTPLRAAINA